MKLYKVSKFAEDYYRNSIKGNGDNSLDTIRKKLTRNIHLANKLLPISRVMKAYQYGNLIIVTRWHKVVWLHNISGNIHFEVDGYQKRKLNKLLDID